MTAVAILTYNRLQTLKKVLASVMTHNRVEDIAVFEDCGQSDGTRQWLTSTTNKVPRPDLLATENHLGGGGIKAFLGTDNLGVSGNSNRALKWFMEETTADHLLLCNDDVEFLGDAGRAYSSAHCATNIGLLCFCDFTSPQYKCTPVTYRGVPLKKLSRMTGMVMSITRNLVESIGYFDPQFGRFGEEHCYYTVRARYAGHQSIMGIHQYCLDIEPQIPVLKHQVVNSTISSQEKPTLDRVAGSMMREKSKRYPFTSPYLGFSLIRNRFTDSMTDVGVETDFLLGHTSV